MSSTSPAPPSVFERDRGEVETTGRAGAPEAGATASGPVERNDMPLPHDPRTTIQGGLLFLAVLAALYFARDVVVPVVLAIVLKLLMQPLVRLIERLRVPRALAALVVVLLLVGLFVGLSMLIEAPAVIWLSNLPQLWPRLQQRFHGVTELLGSLRHRFQSHGINLGGGGTDFHPEALARAVADSTSAVAASALEVLLILYYLLVFGEVFMRRVVEILPRFHNKREAVEMSRNIEHDLSRYLLTVTMINTVVGVLVGLMAWLCGLGGAPLWGVIAFVLNYVPILGPLSGVLVFLVVGVIGFGVEWFAVLPATLYLCIHVAEGEIITPLILARRFTINPVAVLLALIFWYWMWGVIGAALATPMLAIAKIVCDRLRPLHAVGHLLEG